MAQIRVEVTQEDIDHGRREDCHKCPIARSLTRHGFGWVIVDGRHAYVAEWMYAETQSSKLPEVATRFIDEFDKGGKVAPIAFDLDFS